MSAQEQYADTGLADLEGFRAAHRGPVLCPGDAGYDDARIIWNGMIDKRPQVIARATGARDVATAINYARDQGLPLAVRGGGHNVAGNSVVNDGLVICLEGMKQVTVAPEAKKAWVGGGATLGEVDHETQLHGLAAPLGVVSETGVAGLTLHGGMGYLRRKFGMACDAVTGFEVVTAEGRVVWARENENADLFWALKGGGGNFGVVSTFEFDLYPVGPEVIMLGAMYPIDRAPEYMKAWRDYMATSSENLVSQFLAWSLPNNPDFGDAAGKDVIIFGGGWTGPIDEGLEALAPLRELEKPLLDLTGPCTYNELQTGFDPFFGKGLRRNYWKALYLNGLSDEVVNFAAPRMMQKPDPWALIALWSLGGKHQQVAPDATAFGDRSAPFLFSLDIGWEDPAKDEACMEWARGFWSDMHQFSNGQSYLNFPGFGEEGHELLKKTYGEANFERLRDVKTKWDPKNLFKENQNIPPR